MCPTAASGNILNGITHLVLAFGNNLRDELFKEKVGAISIKMLTRTAKERRPGSLGYAEAMLLEYNSKSKYRLPMTKLWAKNGTAYDSEEMVDGEEMNFFDESSEGMDSVDG